MPPALAAAVAPLTRDGARDAARRELGKAIYHRSDPDLLTRALRDVGRLVEALFASAASAAPGGAIGLLLLMLLLLLLLLGVRLRVGPLARTAGGSRPLAGAPARTPAEHRAAAEEAAAAGRYAEAVRERLRGVARDLEDRGVLAARPGRTADELAVEANDALSGQPALRDAARAFDEIWYGGRPATAADYALAVTADGAVGRASGAVARAGGPRAAATVATG